MLEHKQEACMLLQKKCVLVKKKQQNFLPKKNLSLKRLHCSAWRKKKPQEIFTDWFSSTSSFWKNRQNLSLMCSQLYFPGVAIVFVLGFFWHFLSWNYVNNIAKSPCVLLLLACCHSTSSRRCTGWHWVLLLWRGLCPGLAVTGDSKRVIFILPEERRLSTLYLDEGTGSVGSVLFISTWEESASSVNPSVSVSSCQSTDRCIHLLTQTSKYWSGGSWSLPL